MSCTIIRPQDRHEWLKMRGYGIGSSEVGTILGLNPFETPYQLWRRKKGLDGPKEENFAMRAGHYLEDAVSRFYSDATGRNIIKRSAGDWLIVDDDKTFLRVSPDRIFWIDPEGKKNTANKGICECKTTQLDVNEDDLPKHWFCQLQYQLGVSGMKYGALAWLTQGRKFGYKDIEFDAEFYDWMVSEVTDFWNTYIVGDKEPLAETVEDVMIKNPRHIVGKTVEVGSDTLAIYNKLKGINAQFAAVKKEKEELEAQIKLTFGDAEAIVTVDPFDDSKELTLATWKAPKPSVKFDEKRFKEDHEDVYEAYCHEVQGARRFILK